MICLIHGVEMTLIRQQIPRPVFDDDGVEIGEEWENIEYYECPICVIDVDDENPDPDEQDEETEGDEK